MVQKDRKLHVKEVGERGWWIEMGVKNYRLDAEAKYKNEIFVESNSRKQ